MVEEDPKVLLNQWSQAYIRGTKRTSNAVIYHTRQEKREGKRVWCSTATLAFLPGQPWFTFENGRNRKDAECGAARIAAKAFKHEIVETTTAVKIEGLKRSLEAAATRLARTQAEERAACEEQEIETPLKLPAEERAACEEQEIETPLKLPKGASVATPTPGNCNKDVSGGTFKLPPLFEENELETLTSWLIAGSQACLEAEKKKYERRLDALEEQVTNKQEELNREREMHIRQKTHDDLRHADRVRGLHRKFDSQLEQATTAHHELESQLKEKLEVEHQLKLQLEQSRQEVAKMSELVKQAEGLSAARRQKAEGETVCAVCWDRPATQVLVPCGHYGVCTTCLPQLCSMCPICKKPFETHTRVFFASAS
eukprot:TRINITY_DN8121_c0_g1_i3.p1 TRINITY_DN8121_c0_g1~~TRINITY_DN8121_c0_g1_i3.p1  ORF type:complete len:433 (+),score=91.18 TRINITY_DN8121_c0_g1_i3:190-1299(+)